MNLLIDSGNTHTKAALCDADKIIDQFPIKTLEDYTSISQKFEIENILCSSVNKDLSELHTLFPKSKLYELNAQLPIPITIAYKTPNTLGPDRIASVVGATTLFPNENCLSIDAGTCITYDFINDQSYYLGGGISPGMTMRFQALHTFTAKLPLVNQSETFGLIGDSTESSILSGVQVGTCMELEGIIKEYRLQYKDLKVIITGGDAIFFESKIKDSIFVEPRLLFLGLKRILEYNVSKF